MVKIARSFLLILAFAPLVSTLNAATLFVTNLLDNGSPGSLRETIANATSDDIIQFSIAGTITLDQTRGELVVDKKLTIDGQNKITIDGADLTNICIHITGTNASNSAITNITIQHFNGHNIALGTAIELPAYGILADNSATECSVINTVITHINAGLDKEAAGISIFDALDICGNIITFISSEDNPGGRSGVVIGISTTTITGSCNNNTIANLTSGNSSASGEVSGLVVGIFSTNIIGECSHNTLYNFTSGNDADKSSGALIGIAIEEKLSGNCSHNTLYNFTSGNNAEQSGSVGGILLRTLDGNCSDNTCYNFKTGMPLLVSGEIIGIGAENIQGDCSRNTMHTFISADADETAGSIIGIQVLGTIHGNIACNILDNFKGGSSPVPNIIAGIQVDTITGNCFDNKITNYNTENTTEEGGATLGIFLAILNGNCTNNTIENLKTEPKSGAREIVGIKINSLHGNCFSNRITDITFVSTQSIDIFISIGGIQILLADDAAMITCNMIAQIRSNGGTIFGIDILEGNNLTITKNVIDTIENNDGAAYGLLLGKDPFTTRFVTNSLLTFNTISAIHGSNHNGYGIALIGPNTIGNDILNNSIFDINGKAISAIANGAPIDAIVVLDSVRCNVNCSVSIRGQLLPSAQLSNTNQFLIQFFASPDNTPPEAKVLIGEYIHDTSKGTSFEVNLVPFAPTQFGQYLTATATALVEEPGHNLNTSEVSNALPLCALQNNQLCPCPPPSTPPIACPVTCSVL